MIWWELQLILGWELLYERECYVTHERVLTLLPRYSTPPELVRIVEFPGEVREEQLLHHFFQPCILLSYNKVDMFIVQFSQHILLCNLPRQLQFKSGKVIFCSENKLWWCLCVLELCNKNLKIKFCAVLPA